MLNPLIRSYGKKKERIRMKEGDHGGSITCQKTYAWLDIRPLFDHKVCVCVCVCVCVSEKDPASGTGRKGGLSPVCTVLVLSRMSCDLRVTPSLRLCFVWCICTG